MQTKVHPLSRRTLLRTGLAASTLAVAPGQMATAAPAADRERPPDRLVHAPDTDLRTLERKYDVRLGVYAQNLCTGQRMAHRQHERFPMCSVFKPLAVAAVLRDLDQAGEVLDRRIHYTSADLVVHSPITSNHVGAGMTVAELSDAAIRFGDNTAANLLLQLLGGPSAVTRFARSLGDFWTGLDRWEPDLNTVGPHDKRDTTTPAAIATTYRKLLLGHALSRADAGLLTSWMLDIQTGFTRFRAGLPDDWKLADKTGSGAYGVVNDAGIAWTPHGVPITIVALSAKDSPTATGDDQLMADVAHLAATRLDRAHR